MTPGALRAVGALLAWLAALLCAVAAAASEPLPRPGAVVERVLVVGGKQVPLPEGRWIVAGSAPVRHQGMERLGAYGAIRNVVLFRLEGKVVDTVVELNVNELPVADGWGIAGDCLRTDLALAAIRYRSGWDGSCLFLTHTLMQAQTQPAAWREAMALARTESLVLATEWLTVGLRVANRRDVVDARFHFSPAARGFPAIATARWRDSSWAATRIERDPARLAFARKLTEWAVMASGLVEAGIKGRLDPAAALPMPAAEAAGDMRDVVERRLAALDDLLRAGVIEPARHRRQAARLLERGLDPGTATVEPATVALDKTASYWPAATLASMGMGWLWTGQPLAAGVLALLPAVLDGAKFYLHELAWEGTGGVRARRDGTRIVDFAYFGTNG